MWLGTHDSCISDDIIAYPKWDRRRVGTKHRLPLHTRRFIPRHSGFTCASAFEIPVAIVARNTDQVSVRSVGETDETHRRRREYKTNARLCREPVTLHQRLAANRRPARNSQAAAWGKAFGTERCWHIYIYCYNNLIQFSLSSNVFTLLLSFGV